MAMHTDNEITIDAPLGEVWRTANDVRSWPQLFDSEYAEAEILEEAPGRVVFRLTTVPGPRGVRRSWVSERLMDAERHTVHARRVETGPFLYMHIFQSFEETGSGGTRLRWVQDFEVLPEAPFDDAQMAERINTNSRHQLARHKAVIEAAVTHV
ncbi:SRPBCC family protein [Streptomyces tubbatahanensis]|uniref:SRPBCC family protein n=1 Tax=Streptomyces tubbatahanensis TaxID=2923272 RepID=A0ABY3XX42_9ACTN|nr:SRPBCC family protein [Streptomyces tubbatahanensis]UNS99087.1 SRPBCC family protein [Streptomyces tubbatahanensis]